MRIVGELFVVETRGALSVNVHQGNLFDAIPEQLSEELFTNLFSRDSLRIQRIVSRGHATPASGWYDQSENEWVLVLSGEAIIALENAGEVHLKPGSYLNIPAHTRHKVLWTTPNADTVWLAVHYD